MHKSPAFVAGLFAFLPHHATSLKGTGFSAA
jgi:hypothetical protein